VTFLKRGKKADEQLKLDATDAVYKQFVAPYLDKAKQTGYTEAVEKILKPELERLRVDLAAFYQASTGRVERYHSNISKTIEEMTKQVDALNKLGKQESDVQRALSTVASNSKKEIGNEKVELLAWMEEEQRKLQEKTVKTEEKYAKKPEKTETTEQ
jgi:CHASE3 domain sensor protein